MDNEGQFLVEKYDIQYAHSLSVFNEIAKRKYNKSRKPLLALGGAIYDEKTYNKDMIAYNNKSANLELQNNLLRNTYPSLGAKSFKNIPGTLAEVLAISNIIKGSEIMTGNQVTEKKIKQMSESGSLKDYRVIHFATHGFIEPAFPEQSALVLSQFKEEPGMEDGYLRLGEISKLKLNADFVNLSACDTGLGKLYGGEGLVGFTHSFLLAGANSISVSLWNVADESTSQYMSAMYRQKNHSVNYANAIANVKRSFIRGEFGEQYRNPYYWAPFVFYGYSD